MQHFVLSKKDGDILQGKASEENDTKEIVGCSHADALFSLPCLLWKTHWTDTTEDCWRH